VGVFVVKEPFCVEEELLISLMEDLEGHRWENKEDRWRWKAEEGGMFTMIEFRRKEI